MIKLGGLVDLKALHEAESDKYTHIGYGKYKEKGKEDDKDAPTFKKDGEKFVPTSSGDSSSSDSPKKDTPKVNIFDKPKDEPKSDSSSEPDYDKYTNKSQTMTDFFKGDLSIDDLQKVAKKNFDSEIATERDLDGFLNNKFMQDVMADEHGIDRDTLISKVKDLKAKMFGGDKEEPKSKVDLSKYDTSGETDYFEEYDELPDNVKGLIDQHFSSDDGEYDYKQLQNIQKDFEKEGWTFDFGLDGSPYELKPKVKNESKSTRLTSLLPEGLINEGTRSQVGVIKGGKIISVYVHYDGYPSNMKDGLKKHMKDEKDVMTLIKKGGARGIYDDKDIEYYGNMKPMKGDVKNIDDYVKNAGNEASADYVYLYNTADKKWYYAKTYDDTRLKKLF
jgi:hypothetical protein